MVYQPAITLAAVTSNAAVIPLIIATRHPLVFTRMRLTGTCYFISVPFEVDPVQAKWEKKKEEILSFTRKV